MKIVVCFRGGNAWKPQVIPVGALPKPALNNNNSAPPAPVTKTSLAVNKPVRVFSYQYKNKFQIWLNTKRLSQEPTPIGSGYNNFAQPFAAPQVNEINFISIK